MIPLLAQIAVHATVGARYTSTLVRDTVVAPVTVRPAIAPAVALSVAVPVDTTGRWFADFGLDWSSSQMQRHDSGGATESIGGLTTLAITVGLRRELLPWLSARAALGGLKYLPATQSGIFQLGSSSFYGLGAVAVDAAPPFGARWGLAFEARADVHRFSTLALRTEGFQGSQPVFRVALGVRAGIGGVAPR